MRCLRLIDSCVKQLKVQGPSRTCNESKEKGWGAGDPSWSLRTWCADDDSSSTLASSECPCDAAASSLLLPRLELSDAKVYEP